MSQRAFSAARNPLVTALATALSNLLRRDHRGARLRLILVGFLVGGYWLLLGFLANFPRVLPGEWLNQLVFPLNVAVDLISSLFAPEVLLHLLPAAAALWFGQRLAGHYLADLFELESPSLAERYLHGAAFGLGYDTLNIAQGQVKLLNRDSPMLRIGGPGFLQVHLGYAAVMETADGLPRVYGPERERFIRGFERLRDVIDLRDQLKELDEVTAVTGDGIEVRARDVQMVFRVYGGVQERSLQIPYPYTEAAIRRLVYGRAVSEEGPLDWSDELAQLAADEIRSFVGDLTLEEFLALQPEADAPGDAGASHTFHIPRRKLTERFHTKEARARLREHGLELDWVGVGTWEIGTPDEGGVVSIGKTIVGAWQNVQRARLLRSPSYLERQRARGFQDGVHRPLESWIATWESNGFDGRHRCWALLKKIHSTLDALTKNLRREGESTLPMDIDQALDHLEQLSGPRQLGGSRD